MQAQERFAYEFNTSALQAKLKTRSQSPRAKETLDPL